MAGPNSCCSPTPGRNRPPPTSSSARSRTGRFEDASTGSGLDFAGWNMGIAIGDVNNDGRPDVLITQFNGARLFLNRGGLKFQDVTAEAGIRNPNGERPARCSTTTATGGSTSSSSTTWTTTPTHPCLAPGGLRDYCSPVVFPVTASRLFRNRGGPAPNFEDVTEKSGLGEKRGPGLGVAVADFAATAGRTSSWPTTAGPTTCGSISRDGTFREEALPPRRGAFGRRGGVRGNGRGAGRRGQRRPPRSLRLPPDHRDEHALAAGAGGPVPRPVHRLGPDRNEGARHRLRHADGRLRPRWAARHRGRQRPRHARTTPAAKAGPGRALGAVRANGIRSSPTPARSSGTCRATTPPCAATSRWRGAGVRRRGWRRCARPARQRHWREGAALPKRRARSRALGRGAGGRSRSQPGCHRRDDRGAGRSRSTRSSREFLGGVPLGRARQRALRPRASANNRRDREWRGRTECASHFRAARWTEWSKCERGPGRSCGPEMPTAGIKPGRTRHA